MTEAGVGGFWARLAARLWLAGLTAFGMPGALLAGAGEAGWIELTRACEAVIIEQSFEALEHHEPAPFTFGKPGSRQYSVYNTARDLVAVAEVVGGDWLTCYVRESDESRSRTRDFIDKWPAWFKAAFPRPKYRWGGSLLPDRPGPAGVRCADGTPVLAVYASIEVDFHFRIIVTRSSKRMNTKLCREEGA